MGELRFANAVYAYVLTIPLYNLINAIVHVRIVTSLTNSALNFNCANFKGFRK